MENYKIIALLKAIASGIVWGLGQLFNKQFLKAAMFFFVFLIILTVEFTSGNYGSEFNLYEDKIPGEEVKESITDGFITNYYYNLESVTGGAVGTYAYVDYEFLEFVAEVNGIEFETNNGPRPYFSDNGNEVQPENLEILNDDLYQYIADQLIEVEAEVASGGAGDLESQAEALANEVIDEKVVDELRELSLRDVRGMDDYETTLQTTIETLATTELEGEGHTVGEPDWDDTLSARVNQFYERFLLEAEELLVNDYYDTAFDLYETETRSKIYLLHYVNNYEKFYFQLYGEFAVQNESVLAFQNYLYDTFFQGSLEIDNDDANKMLLRIYFLTKPVEYDLLVNGDSDTEGLDNHYYERGGFFTKGLWGVITLGEVPLTSVSNHETLGFLLPSTGSRALEYQQIQLEGHHSTRLLLNGLISLIAVLYLLVLYIWNIRDAYNTSVKNYLAKQENQERETEREYYKNLYENFFEYIVLSPALILISFISIMPILFGIAVAFTNYNIEHIPPGQLVEWVGLQNFREVFSFASGEGTIDFGGQFWKVFSWTLIWAFAATFTCFFGGFIQAVIISNKRVVFRKMWRSILILPWAVPALISQMIFRVMFQDTGYVNQVLAKMGVTQYFIDMGFIGKTYQEAIAAGPVERFFHMGTETFQWLSNEANPWFVRVFIIVLNIWLGFPFFMALMSGVMTSIDKSLYEAASIDGATGFQQFRYITMPLVLFATSPLLVMTFSGNFNNFGVIYFITGGGPGAADYTTAFAGNTDILISWIYNLTTDPNIRWYNMASTFSILIFLIIGSVSAWNFTRTRAFREGD